MQNKYTRHNGHVEAVELTGPRTDYLEYRVVHTPYTHRLRTELYRGPNPVPLMQAYFGADGVEIDYVSLQASMIGWMRDGSRIFPISPLNTATPHANRKLSIAREQGITDGIFLLTAGRLALSRHDEHGIDKLLQAEMVFDNLHVFGSALRDQAPLLMQQPLVLVRVSTEALLDRGEEVD